jgi:hypothetical protein
MIEVSDIAIRFQQQLGSPVGRQECFGQSVFVICLSVLKSEVHDALDVTVGGFSEISWLERSVVIDA